MTQIRRWITGGLVCLLASLAWAMPAWAEDTINLDHPYAIQLKLSSKPFVAADLPNLSPLAPYRIYVSTEGVDPISYRLRVGFFATAKAGGAISAQVQKAFPGAWVTRVSEEERRGSHKYQLTPGKKKSLLSRLFSSKKAAPPVPIDISQPYAIQLRLTDQPITFKDLPKIPELAGNRAYLTTITRDGLTWYQLRLGFFPTAKAAAALKPALEPYFAGNWVTRTKQAERDASAAHALVANKAVKKVKKEKKRKKKEAAPPAPVSIRASDAYAIQLLRSPNAIDPSTLPDLPLDVLGYRLYIIQSTLNGKTRHSLRLGFFPSAKAAAKHQKVLSKQFKGNWVTRVSVAERRAAVEHTVTPGTPLPVSAVATGAPLAALPAEQEARLKSLMEKGREAITRRDYDRAIQVFTGILGMDRHPLQPDALEFLGLARERNGQFAHAKAEYQRYLEAYPDSDGAPRVRQRLAGLVTAAKVPNTRLRASKYSSAAITWHTSGGINQYYRYNVDVDQDGNDQVVESSLSTNLDLNVRSRGGGHNFRARFSGDYRKDLLNKDAVQRGRITTLYIDASHRASPWSTRIGRMTETSGGVLGRFDGATVSRRMSPKTKLNLVMGYPVDFSTAEQINTDKRFVGLNAGLGTFADAWDLNLFAIQQTFFGVLDRRAVGAEVRYFKANRSLFGLLDYDVLFSQLNTVLLLGNLTLPSKSTLNFMIDIRNTPVLTSSNALQGQPVRTLGELADLIDTDTIHALAAARTNTSSTLTLGGTRPFNDRVQLNLDVTLSQLGGTDGSDAVPGIPGSTPILAVKSAGLEYFINSQLIVSQLITDNDVSIIGARYANTATSTVTSLSLNTRMPAGSRWRFNPRLRLDLRNNTNTNSKDQALFPALRADYRMGKFSQLEILLGGDVTRNSFGGNSSTSYGYNFSFGYRLNF